MIKVTRLTLIMVAFAVLTGCGAPESAARHSVEPSTRPAGPSGDAGYMAKIAVRADAAPKDETAVDTALQWAKKYSEAAEKINVLQQENTRLSNDLTRANKDSDGLRAELDKAQARLADADRALKDFDEALRQWKKDVLGHRDEMREASKAQMLALGKIMRMLSGEVAPVSAAQPSGSTSAPASAAATKDAHQ